MLDFEKRSKFDDEEKEKRKKEGEREREGSKSRRIIRRKEKSEEGKRRRVALTESVKPVRTYNFTHMRADS